MNAPLTAPVAPGDKAAGPARTARFAVLSDTHISPAGTADGVWNNATRRSRAGEILMAALAEIVGHGHSTVLMLGDISDDGSTETIRRALSMIAQAGLTACVVPGNHDTAQRADAIDAAAAPVSSCTVLHQAPQPPEPGIALVGVGLESADGGNTCTAARLPDVTDCTDDLLLWAGHYPLLSQRARLRTAGLRYPGDLVNLQDARQAAERFTGPIVVLHGHLHAAVTLRAGRILQLGCPATVEWPHAWTDLTVDTGAGGARVRAWTRPIAGEWSKCERNSQLVPLEQSWQFGHGSWHAAGTGRIHLPIAGCGSGLARSGYQADDRQLAVGLVLVLREAGRGSGDLLPGLCTLRPG
jgi:Calcineurin-like phosphoesterase